MKTKVKITILLLVAVLLTGCVTIVARYTGDLEAYVAIPKPFVG